MTDVGIADEVALEADGVGPVKVALAKSGQAVKNLVKEVQTQIKTTKDVVVAKVRKIPNRSPKCRDGTLRTTTSKTNFYYEKQGFKSIGDSRLCDS